MLPYYEQHDKDSEYMERDVDICESATDVYSAYLNKSWDTLAELNSDRRQLIEKWERNASVSDLKTEGGFRKYTESEIFDGAYVKEWTWGNKHQPQPSISSYSISH